MTSKFFGEFMGTLILILLGNGAVAGVLLKHSKGAGSGWIVITAGWGFAVMSGILTAIDSAPDACEQVWWGKRLAAVGVSLSRVDRQFLGELLTDAWEQKAPRRLLTQ